MTVLTHKHMHTDACKTSTQTHICMYFWWSICKHKSGPQHLPSSASCQCMTPCLGCVNCLEPRDERTHKACLGCCRAHSHITVFPLALYPSTVIIDTHYGCLIYILCHIWMCRLFYLLTCVLSLVCLCCLCCLYCLFHTHAHRHIFVWCRWPILSWALSRHPRHIEQAALWAACVYPGAFEWCVMKRDLSYSDSLLHMWFMLSDALGLYRLYMQTPYK